MINDLAGGRGEREGGEKENCAWSRLTARLIAAEHRLRGTYQRTDNDRIYIASCLAPSLESFSSNRRSIVQFTRKLPHLLAPNDLLHERLTRPGSVPAGTKADIGILYPWLARDETPPCVKPSSRACSLLLSVRNRIDIPGKGSPLSLVSPLALGLFLSPCALVRSSSHSLLENETARDSLKSPTCASSLSPYLSRLLARVRSHVPFFLSLYIPTTCEKERASREREKESEGASKVPPQRFSR